MTSDSESAISHRDEEFKEVEAVIVGVVILVAMTPLMLMCLYCLFPKLRKKKPAEQANIAPTEQSKLAENGNVGNGANGNHNPFQKLSTMIMTSTAFSTSSRRSLQRQSSSESQYTVHDRPPMTLKTETVQPPNRSYSAGSSAPKESLVRKPSGLLRLIGNEIFQDDNKPPTGAEFLGKLQYAVSYDEPAMVLTVRIIKAVELPAMDLSGTSDPFVKCCLLPDRKRKLQTNIRRKTCNPSWGETFLFEGLPYDKIIQRVLYMQVLDHDRFSRNDPIGEIYVTLRKLNLNDNTPTWEYLAPCKGSNKRGALLLSLNYEPLLGILKITVHRATDLKCMDVNGLSDPYVKIWQLHKGKRVVKKKTRVYKKNLNPEFNQKFEFDCPMERLRDTQIEISVIDQDTVGRNDIIGKIYLGYKSQSIEKQHWKDMLNNVRSDVQQWHVLKV